MIVHMVGNAHIDPIWMWNWQAGVDEALASFRAAVERCHEYPDFTFTRGEAWLYDLVERLDPELFAEVKALIAAGKWHVTGGQYIQPDVNAPTASGLRQQIVHGQRYFRDKFGISPDIAYNVDSFGHPATMPDILTEFDYRGYVFHRPHPDQVALPGQTFRWRGVKGGEVIGFRIVPGYTTRSDSLYGQIMLSVEAADPALGHTMCFYGVGDHGGGPTKGNIEYILENQHFADDIELRFSTPQHFFDVMTAKRELLPEVTFELQRTFPGCYSVMHDIKQAQRHSEHQLDVALDISKHYALEAEQGALEARIDIAWQDLLFTAFHDILAGTSVASAWGSVRAMQGRARIIAEEVIVEATRGWSLRTLPPVNHQQLVVINPDAAPWQGLVEAEPWLDFDSWRGRWVSDAQDNPIPFQRVQAEAMQITNRILLPAQLEPYGHTHLLIRDDPAPEQTIDSDLHASGSELGNSDVTVQLNHRGIADIRYQGVSLLAKEGITLHLREDTTDTWTFHTDRFVEPVLERLHGIQWVVEETGPLRARVRAEGVLGYSRWRWTISVHQHDPRIFMKLDINYAERLRLLQMPIDLVEAPEGHLDGLAAGWLERQPSEIEHPVQGWSRVVVADKQLALTTQDAYSVSLNGCCWQWSLLRSPHMAWGGGRPAMYAGHDDFTDQGVHHFAMTLHPAEQLAPEKLEAAARQMARPLITFDRTNGMKRQPWGAEAPRSFWHKAEHRAAQDGKMRNVIAKDDTPGGLFYRQDEDKRE